MATAMLTSNERATILKGACDEAGIHTGGWVYFTLFDNGILVVRVKRRGAANFANMLKPHRKLPVADLSHSKLESESTFQKFP